MASHTSKSILAATVPRQSSSKPCLPSSPCSSLSPGSSRHSVSASTARAVGCRRQQRLSSGEPCGAEAQSRRGVSPPGSAAQDSFAFTDGPPPDEKFVELESEMQAYGPPAVLLLGFSEEDRGRVRNALDKYGAGFVPVAFATQSMLNSMSLWDAMQEAASPNHEAGSDSPPAKAPQVLLPQPLGAEGAGGVPANVGLCLMSGLTGEECMEVVDIVDEELSHLGRSGLAFAAMLPSFSQRALRDVVSDILGDHVSCAAGEV